MPNKFLHSAQGLFKYKMITGSDDVVGIGLNGFSKGDVIINAPGPGITTFKDVEYITSSLADDKFGIRTGSVSNFYSVGGVYSDFHLFASPQINTRMLNFLTSSLTASNNTEFTGNLQIDLMFTPEEVKAWPRVNISSSHPHLVGMDPLKAGGDVKKTLGLLKTTSLRPKSLIVRSVASKYNSFKVPWDCVLTQSGNGDLGVERSKNAKRSINAYDPQYYLWFRTLATMSKVFSSQLTTRNDDGAVYDTLFNLSDARVGPGGSKVPGTITGSNVPDTTIVVRDSAQSSDNFDALVGQSGIAIIQQSNEPGCFPAGTRILGETGEVYIENIKPGDKVASFDPKGIFVMNEVKVLLVHKTGEPALEITTTNDTTIQSTFYHKFYHPGLEIYKPIHQFQIGDPLRMKVGNTFIKEIKKIDSFEVEYNLELVGEPRSYLANGIVVHNAKGAPPLYPTDIVSPGDINPNL